MKEEDDPIGYWEWLKEKKVFESDLNKNLRLTLEFGGGAFGFTMFFAVCIYALINLNIPELVISGLIAIPFLLLLLHGIYLIEEQGY